MGAGSAAALSAAPDRPFLLQAPARQGDENGERKVAVFAIKRRAPERCRPSTWSGIMYPRVRTAAISPLTELDERPAFALRIGTLSEARSGILFPVSQVLLREFRDRSTDTRMRYPARQDAPENPRIACGSRRAGPR